MAQEDVKTAFNEMISKLSDFIKKKNHHRMYVVF